MDLPVCVLKVPLADNCHSRFYSLIEMFSEGHVRAHRENYRQHFRLHCTTLSSTSGSMQITFQYTRKSLYWANPRLQACVSIVEPMLVTNIVDDVFGGETQ